jgi:hypothetical protein
VITSARTREVGRVTATMTACVFVSWLCRPLLCLGSYWAHVSWLCHPLLCHGSYWQHIIRWHGHQGKRASTAAHPLLLSRLLRLCLCPASFLLLTCLTGPSRDIACNQHGGQDPAARHQGAQSCSDEKGTFPSCTSAAPTGGLAGGAPHCSAQHAA